VEIGRFAALSRRRDGHARTGAGAGGAAAASPRRRRGNRGGALAGGSGLSVGVGEGERRTGGDVGLSWGGRGACGVRRVREHGARVRPEGLERGRAAGATG
jgi:hypothetical protein